jgi:hypothetical protein
MSTVGSHVNCWGDVAVARQRFWLRLAGPAIPIWVKHGINAWMTAAGIEDGRLLRSVSKREILYHGKARLWNEPVLGWLRRPSGI